MCDVENCLFLQQLKKGEQDMEENVGQKDKEKVEEEMIEQAFQQLLNDYLATKHRKRIEIITKAFNFANQAHKGIKRRSGEPYIMHPLAVAQIVCNEIGLGSTSICAALLHDVVEDTDYTVEDIENIFGPKIAQIVDGLTKISGGIFGDRASAQAENFKKLLLTMSDDNSDQDSRPAAQYAHVRFDASQQAIQNCRRDIVYLCSPRQSPGTVQDKDRTGESEFQVRTS